MPIVLRCHTGIGPAVTGTALVAKDNFSARYDLDRKAGVFSRPSHALAGQSYAGRILVLDQAKGGVATAWMLHEMKARGIVPLALIFNRVNPILAQGAAFGGVTMVDRFDRRRDRPDPHRRPAAHRPGRRHGRDPQPRARVDAEMPDIRITAGPYRLRRHGWSASRRRRPAPDS